MYTDIVGYEDLVGADYNQGQLVVGADGNAGVAAQVAARNAVLVRDRAPTRARQYPLGFPTTSISASSTATVTAQTQVVFRPRRLVIPSDIAGSLNVNDLKVGKNSMWSSSSPIPARVFTEAAVGVDLQLDTAQVSQLISLSLENTSGAAVTFNGALIGDALE